MILQTFTHTPIEKILVNLSGRKIKDGHIGWGVWEEKGLTEVRGSQKMMKGMDITEMYYVCV